MIKDMPCNRETYPLSVVVATLGGDTLTGTIEHLNRGTVIPAEILVCIPEEDAFRVKGLSFQNVRIIKTPCRGQVAQRAYGLQCVRQLLVLQLDDDIMLQPENLYKLIQALYQLGHGNTVAPIYRDLMSGHCVTECHWGIVGWLQSLYALLVCDAPWGAKRMGAVSPAGIGYGVDEKHCGPALLETQWQPGGCVLCYREDLITENYYPFAGKAYCEDLIHSVLWRKRGVHLWVLPSAYCMIFITPEPFSWSSIKADMRAHYYVVRLSGGKVWRLMFWHLIYVSKRVIFSMVNRGLPSSRSK